MNRKLSALLMAGHCFACCQAQTLQTKPVIITASLVHADSTTPKAMVLNFLNPFIKGRKSAAFDEHGQISSSEEMLFTQNMTIQYNKGFINLYVQPGDSVHLQIDGSLLKQPGFKWLTISGDHALASTQLNKWHYYFNTRPSKQFVTSVPMHAMTDSVKKVYAESIRVLEEYAVKNGMDPLVKNWALNDIKYTVSYWVSDYLTTKDSVSGRVEYHHALYADSLFDQYNMRGFQSMMFPYHLANYAYTLLKTDSAISLLQQSGKYAAAASKGVQLIVKEPEGIARDYMLFNFLSGYISKSPTLLDSLPGIARYFSSSLSLQFLLRVANETIDPGFTEKPISGISYLEKNNSSTPVPSVEVFGYLAQRYPGKILYVDVYATWCVPCLQEMVFLPAIKAQLDTSKVAFINLCLQSSKADWLALIEKRKLKGENYLLDDDASKLFMGLYKIGGFPTYMLFDKKGKLRSAAAPRPSDQQELIKAIDKLTGTGN